MLDPSILVTLFRLLLKDRPQLVLENVALRQQLAVYKRTVKLPRIEDRDRIFWLSLMGMLKEWKEALVFAELELVHREPHGGGGSLRLLRSANAYVRPNVLLRGAIA